MFRALRKEKKKILKQELFYFLSTLLLALIILELIFPRIVLAYFNLNYLFILVVISAINLFVNVKR